MLENLGYILSEMPLSLVTYHDVAVENRAYELQQQMTLFYKQP
jgi:hypothetical protein